MLEFIVTGQIPGTNFVLTLSWLVAIAVIIGGSSLLRREHKHHDHTEQTNIEDIAI